MYSDRRGTDKNLPGQNFPDWRPLDKIPKNNWERICTEGFVRVFCTRPVVRDVRHTLGGPGMCDKVWKRGGVKIGQK